MTIHFDERSQRTAEWLKARCGKVTASEVFKLFTGIKGESYGETYGTYLKDVASERVTDEPIGSKFSSIHARRGREHEREALELYDLLAPDFEIKTAFFIDHKEIKNFGASPDGLVNEDGSCEIKCPSLEVFIDFLKEGKIKKAYFYQMQAVMMCADREWCDFIYYYRGMPVESSIKIVRVWRNDKVCEEIAKQVNLFNERVEEKIKEWESLATGIDREWWKK